jgi:hypothetical protein
MRLIPVRFIILSAKHSVHWEFFDFILSFWGSVGGASPVWTSF